MSTANWAALSRAERDAAYDNRAAVPNAPALIAESHVLSATYRAAHGAHLNLAYGPNPRTQWDLYPAKDAAAPCLIFIHGGYWQLNRREDFACYAAGIAAHGWSVAMPGYSLAPDATLTQILAELRAALDWLARHGPAHGIAGKIFISGWSAGGHLAAMLLDHPAVTAGLALSGVYELGPLRDTYLNANLQLSDDEIINLSPLRLAAVQKPLTLAYGSRELPALVADSRDLHAKRAAAHAPGALVPIPGGDHFTVMHALRSENGALVRALVDMAKEV
jgi:arylformamidase